MSASEEEIAKMLIGNGWDIHSILGAVGKPQEYDFNSYEDMKEHIQTQLVPGELDYQMAYDELEGTV